MLLLLHGRTYRWQVLILKIITPAKAGVAFIWGIHGLVSCLLFAGFIWGVGCCSCVFVQWGHGS